VGNSIDLQFRRNWWQLVPISYTVATETVGELTGFELTGYYRERLGPTTVIHCWAERSASQMKIV